MVDVERKSLLMVVPKEIDLAVAISMRENNIVIDPVVLQQVKVLVADIVSKMISKCRADYDDYLERELAKRHTAAIAPAIAPTAAAAPVSDFFGYCTPCDKCVAAKITRRCLSCFSDAIEEVKDVDVTNLSAEYDNCRHLGTTTCTWKKCKFFGSCFNHSDKYLQMVPQVFANKTGIVCSPCEKVEQMLLRFGCNHVICLNCWRKYTVLKLNNRELLFNTPTISSDPTLCCPVGCRKFIVGDNAFRILGKVLFAQYVTLGMEQMVGRKITPESTLGRVQLKKIENVE
ncbi:MAG: putative E3 ubiquitin-protein ligase parkin [Harvfovirus sp.]|uniref:Putative E3 ubiquitin-protein ligase parkin n=1 Tax=Harvfovirus sp. TaxID=2487768 RepID=A0A3G5A0J9_9VIRU|nr:MAG: putative E3 ubiquitin-protein ligase parkin [Harvfovirus sp.]